MYEAIEKSSPSTQRKITAIVLSLLFPGAGDLLLGYIGRGSVLLVISILLILTIVFAVLLYPVHIFIGVLSVLLSLRFTHNSKYKRTLSVLFWIMVPLVHVLAFFMLGSYLGSEL